MNIHVYTMCYNEEILMPYFLRHYESFAERIFVFDHYSDDNTVKIVNASQKTTCVPYGIYGEVNDSVLLKMKNEAYKSSRGDADWVMVVDVDEFVYHPNLIALLKEYITKGITLPKTDGCDMVSDEVLSHPGQIYEVIKRGVRDSMFSKRAVFNPSLDINYFPGAHKCNPSRGFIESDKADIKILHYRFLSSDFIVKRLETRTKRLSEENLKRGWGVIKCSGEETLRSRITREYEERKAARVQLI